MNGKVEIMYTISKKAYGLIKKGKAVVQSGGVRALDGTLVELAVPATQIMSDGVSSISAPGIACQIVNLVSSIGNNVQSAFIQKGVNQANKKLDKLLDVYNGIFNELHALAAFEVANLALNLINIGVSVKNFSDIKDQINCVKHNLDSLTLHVKKMELYDYISDCNKYLSYIENCHEELIHTKYKEHLPVSVSNSISEIESYLKKIICLFNNRDIDGTIGCNIILSLVPYYVQIVKEYSVVYYYTYEKLPNVYYKCNEILESLNSEFFKKALKAYLMIDCAEISAIDMYRSFSGITFSINANSYNFQYFEKLLKVLPQKDYENLDKIIMDKILDENSIIKYDEERVFIPIGEYDLNS